MQNFVVVDPDFGDFGLIDLVDGRSPFSVGLDPITDQLRPEAVPFLEQLGEAMNDDAAVRIGLAGYSFDQLDPGADRRYARAAVDAVIEFLTVRAGVDPERISPLTPADAQFIVPQRAGNHVAVQWGEHLVPAAAVATLGQDGLGFVPGTDQPTEQTAAALDEILTILDDADGSLVIDVHTHTEADRDANRELSERQAAALAGYLVEGGLATERIRAYGSGDGRQFRDGSSDGRIVLTYVP